jgi:hypothetical protein
MRKIRFCLSVYALASEETNIEEFFKEAKILLLKTFPEASEDLQTAILNFAIDLRNLYLSKLIFFEKYQREKKNFKENQVQ